jgi:hypothetical protein
MNLHEGLRTDKQHCGCDEAVELRRFENHRRKLVRIEANGESVKS